MTDDTQQPQPVENPPESDAEPARPPMNVLFRLALVPAGLFIVTILGFTAIQLGNADAPVPRWLNANAGWLIAVEVAASVLLATMAMAVDRRAIVSESAKRRGRD